MTAGVAMLIVILSEDDMPLSRWDITSSNESIVARHTVIILFKNCFSLKLNLLAQCASIFKRKQVYLKMESYTESFDVWTKGW